MPKDELFKELERSLDSERLKEYIKAILLS